MQFFIRLFGLFLISWTYSLPLDSFLDVDGISVAAGTDHVCAIEAHADAPIGGKVRCWGNNEYGKLKPPKNVVSGQYFSCGISTEQSLHCWGWLQRPRAEVISGLYSQISAGRYFVCGVMTDGQIDCLGVTDAASNSLIPKLSEGRVYVQVSCGYSHCCGLDDEGKAHCWGISRNPKALLPPQQKLFIDYKGDLVPPNMIEDAIADDGEGGEEEDMFLQEYDDSTEEEKMKELQSKGITVKSEDWLFKQISVGQGFSCGIRVSDSSLHCWGDKNKHNIPRLPAMKLGRDEAVIPGSFKQVSVGRAGVCAIQASTGLLSCWGLAKHFLPDNLIEEDTGEPMAFDQVSVGYSSVCAVTAYSQLKCFGGGLGTAVPADVEIA